MFKIKSRLNEKIKLLKKLSQKKYREQHDKFLVENWNIIKDAKEAGVEFESLFITEEFLKKNKTSLRDVAETFRFPQDKTKYPHGDLKVSATFLITKEINKTFSNLDTPSGVCAVYKKSPSRHSRGGGNLEIDLTKPVIYLNEINDPGNLGTILRTAVAFDFENIVVDEKCADLYNSKTISSAKEAIFKLNISFDKNLKLLKKIKKEMKVFSADASKGKAPNSLGNGVAKCVVFGNEARGVDERVKKLSDGFIKIKMSERMESLNVAVATGIILHEFYKD